MIKEKTKISLLTCGAKATQVYLGLWCTSCRDLTPSDQVTKLLAGPNVIHTEASVEGTLELTSAYDKRPYLVTSYHQRNNSHIEMNVQLISVTPLQ